MRRNGLRGWGLILLLVPGWALANEPATYHFGVINQRSLALTAEFWNPILDHAGQRAGVRLRLKMGKTAPETTAQSVNGEHDFVYSNHLFTPERQRLGFRAIARFDTPPVRGALVVPADSPAQGLRDLSGKNVVFPSPEAFLGYHLPIQELRRARVPVQEQFAGNQEGAMARLRSGAAQAAGVSLAVMDSYARRENYSYRILWTSQEYLDIPVMAHPRVPKHVAEAVRNAFADMRHDAPGREVLARSAAAVGQKQPTGFVKVDDRDYDSYRAFYREFAGAAVKP